MHYLRIAGFAPDSPEIQGNLEVLDLVLSLSNDRPLLIY